VRLAAARPYVRRARAIRRCRLFALTSAPGLRRLPGDSHLRLPAREGARVNASNSGEGPMTDDIKTLHHMITVWNAFGTPTVIPPQMLRTLGDYLENFLKSGEGEKYLRTLGYVRSEAVAERR
jgi:hypothetical protein